MHPHSNRITQWGPIMSDARETVQTNQARSVDGCFRNPKTSLFSCHTKTGDLGCFCVIRIEENNGSA